METSIHTEAKPGIGHNGRPAFEDLPSSAFVGVSTVKPLFDNPVDSTLWRWISNGQFPEPERRTGKDGKGPRQWTVGLIRRVQRGEWKPEDKAA